MNNGEIRAFIETYKNVKEDSKYEFSGAQILQIVKVLEQQPSDESIKYLECNDIDVQKFTEAVKMQPLQIIKPNTSDDCVSRQAVIEYIKDCGAELGHDIENESVREDILNMPPVTPTHKTGKWIFAEGIKGKDNVEKCSCCGSHWKEAIIYRTDTKEYLRTRLLYCPSCGADMRGGENE